MNKEIAIEAIVNAKKAHESRMQKIETIIEDGVFVTFPVVTKAECAFGGWLYDVENNLQSILGSLFYNNLDELHTKWFSEYLRIFNIFQTQKKKGFLSKVLKKHVVDDLEIDKAKLYYVELKETSEELLKALGSSERRTRALPESKFA